MRCFHLPDSLKKRKKERWGRGEEEILKRALWAVWRGGGETLDWKLRMALHGGDMGGLVQ